MIVDVEIGNQRCFSSHIGFWAIEPVWLEQAISVIGEMEPVQVESVARGTDSSGRPRYYPVTEDGIATMIINGPMMKITSKFGGTSSTLARRDIRQAVRDDEVKAILLRIDSPGGHVAGTNALAQDVVSANKSKPVYAHIEDLGASAAYWVASGAHRITAEPTSEVGSIGTVAIIEDSSGAASDAGIKVYVVSTGEYKGAFVPGTEVTDEQLDYVKDRVNILNGFFLDAVSNGRGLTGEALNLVSDGRVWVAKAAQDLGLIDSVSTLDDAVAEISDVIENKRQAAEARRRLTTGRLRSRMEHADLES